MGDQASAKTSESLAEMRALFLASRREAETRADNNVTVHKKSKDAILDSTLESFKHSADAQWAEHLVVGTDSQINVQDPNDDLNRELEFYKATRKAAMHGMVKLLKENIKVIRPDDYFAEMVKDDVHMQKVKGQLIYQERKMDAYESRKKAQHNKKYMKQIKATRAEEKAKRKRANIDAVSAWRNKRKRGNANEEDLAAAIGGNKFRGRRGHARGGRGGKGRGRGRGNSNRRPGKNRRHSLRKNGGSKRR